jgi:hypothetical protein
MTAAALTYVYMVIGVIRNHGEGLTLSTYVLWAALGWIVTFNLRSQKIDAKLVTVYALGATGVSIALLFMRKTGWSQFDTVVAILVIICLFVWKTAGAHWALIAMVTAGLIASLLFVVMTWKNPEMSPIVANLGFFLANLLTYLSAKVFGDKLYAGVNTLLCGFLAACWIAHAL